MILSTFQSLFEIQLKDIVDVGLAALLPSGIIIWMKGARARLALGGMAPDSQSYEGYVDRTLDHIGSMVISSR